MSGFASRSSKSVLVNTDTTHQLSQAQIQEMKAQKASELSDAVWYSREKLAAFIMQRFDRSSSTGSILEASLKDKWQHCVSTHSHNVDAKNKHPQLYCRLDLSKDNGTKNLLELYEGAIPTKFDKSSQKEVPITLTSRNVISYANKNDPDDRPGKAFRMHINTVWLPDGLEIRIYPAKDINDKRVDWVYNCSIQRVMHSTSCAWDDDFEVFSDTD